MLNRRHIKYAFMGVASCLLTLLPACVRMHSSTVRNQGSEAQDGSIGLMQSQMNDGQIAMELYKLEGDYEGAFEGFTADGRRQPISGRIEFSLLYNEDTDTVTVQAGTLSGTIDQGQEVTSLQILGQALGEVLHADLLLETEAINLHGGMHGRWSEDQIFDGTFNVADQPGRHRGAGSWWARRKFTLR